MNSMQRLRIFHPSDFSKDSNIAFAHAVKMVLQTKGSLDILHVMNGRSPDETDFPQVRAQLEKWSVLPKNSPKSAIADLHIYVRKIIKKKKDPVDACLDHLEHHPIDLIVLMIHQSKLNWISKRVGEPIARKSHQMTLFIPQGNQGFVSEEDGSMSLNHVLVPIAPQPAAEQGIIDLRRLTETLGIENLKVSFLYVGDENDAPEIGDSPDPAWDTEMIIKQGDPADQIIETADEISADMVLMITEGRHGFVDALRGSVSERVLKRVNCPLLSVPATQEYNA